MSLSKVYVELDRFAKYGRIDAEELAEQHDQKDFTLYRDLYDKMDDVYRLMKYLNKEIIGEYPLYENADGRFEAFDGCYYTSGSSIEFYDTDFERWYLSRVESSNGEYYIVDFKNVQLDGLLVRVRSN